MSPGAARRGPRPARAAAALALALLGSACAPPCSRYLETFCDACASEALDYVCTCVASGSLAAGDYPDGTFPSEQDATLACQEFLLENRYPDSDAEASCVASSRLLEVHGTGACQDVPAPAF